MRASLLNTTRPALMRPKPTWRRLGSLKPPITTRKSKSQSAEPNAIALPIASFAGQAAATSHGRTLWAQKNSKHLGTNAVDETQTPNTVVSPKNWPRCARTQKKPARRLTLRYRRMCYATVSAIMRSITDRFSHAASPFCEAARFI